MAVRFLDRALISPLLLLNFALYVIVLAIAGWALDSMMEGYNIYGNAATPNFSLFCLISGVVGIASIFSGLHLAKDWRDETNVSASSSSALIAWFLLLPAFGLACKEIHIGHQNTTLKFMEAFVIILTATHGFYLMLLHNRYFESLT